MDDNYRHFSNMKLKRELAGRAEDLKIRIENARHNLAHEIQGRKENAAREDRDEKHAHARRMAREKGQSDEIIERLRGANAESLELLRTNLGLQTRIIGDDLDEINHGREVAKIAHNALADAFRSVVGALAGEYTAKRKSEREHAQAMEMKRLELENDLLRAQMGHANALELAEKQLDHDLMRAQMAHDNIVGLETARHQQEIFLAIIQSRLRNEEVTHAEIVRLMIRMMEGANARASDRDAKKWASECMDEWERERKGRI